jgi:hypothetical protein
LRLALPRRRDRSLRTPARRVVPATRTLSLVALAGALALAACGDATGPKPVPTVTVRLTALRGPFYESMPDGRTALSCELDLEATATGGGSAGWSDATFYYYFGKDRQTPTDSQVLAASEVIDSWGGAAWLATGQVRKSGWEVGAYAPFGLAIEYRYIGKPGDKPRRARVETQCGPAVPASAPPPSVTSLTVSPAGDIEPGDRIVATYTATSAAGLWQTAVTLEGACEAVKVFGERLETSATHTVELIVPADCELGGDLIVNVYAWDAALQSTMRGVALEGAVSDHTPPGIQPMFLPPTGGSLSYPPITAELFAGDSLRLMLTASDNHALRAIVWEVLPSGFKDSIVVSGASTTQWVWIPFRAEWGRDVQLRLYARDAEGLTSAVVESPPGAIKVYPTVERPVKKATVSGEVRTFVHDEKRDVLYLLQTNERRIAVFSLASMSVTSTFQLPFPLTATDGDLSLSGDSLILAVPYDTALAVVDLRQATLQATLVPLRSADASIGQMPWAVRVLANGHAFVAFQGSTPAAYRLLDIDLATGAERLRDDAVVGGSVVGIERSGDRSMLVASGGNVCWQRYDVAGDTFRACQAGSYGIMPSVDVAGRNFAAGVKVYDETLSFTREVHSLFAGGVPYSTISADGQYLYQVHSQLGVIRSRVSDGALVDRTPNSIQPNALRATSDGSRLITVDSHNDATSRISVIDLR